MNDFAVVKTAPLLESFVFDVERRTVQHGSETFDRDVVTHPGAVAIMAIRDDGAVAMLRQWRVTFQDVNWELPAGTRDLDGEDPAKTAARELKEEVGCEASEIRPLCEYMNSRGWTTQTTIVYVATGLRFGDRAPEGPEEHATEVHWLSKGELEAIVRSRQVMEASTLLALLWYLPGVLA